MATVPTTINSFSTTTNDNWPEASDSVAPSLDDVLRLYGSSIATLRDLVREDVIATDPAYGAVGNGVADDITPLIAAIAAGASKRLRLPAGTYKVGTSAASLLTCANGIEIVGDGIDRTILKLEGTATYFNGLNVTGSGVSISNLTIQINPGAGNEAAGVRVTGSDFMMDRVKIDGGVTFSGSFNHTAYGILLPSTGTQRNITVTRCIFTRLNFPLLKANGATSTQENVSFTGCLFEGNFREDLSFNSPLGGMSGVRVHNCHFRNHAGLAAGQDSIYIALASVSEFSVLGNTFAGSVREAIHIEEECREGSVVGNCIDCTIDEDGAGISILENDVAGPMVLPRNIVISGNTIRQAGTAKASLTHGVWLINNSSADDPGEAIVISDNIAEGFDVGFAGQASNGAAVVVRGNLAIGCAAGYRWRPSTSLSISGNTSRECDEGVASVNGGTYVDHRFVDCTLAADAETSFPMVLVNPRFEFTEESFSASETKNFVLLPLGADSRLHGFGSTYVNSDTSPRYSSRRDELTYNGSALTVTNKMLIAPSSLQSFLEESGGNLRCRVFSSVSLTSVRVTAWIDGHFVLAL